MTSFQSLTDEGAHSLTQHVSSASAEPGTRSQEASSLAGEKDSASKQFTTSPLQSCIQTPLKTEESLKG